MKKSKKTLLLAAGILLAAGLLAFGTSLCLGGSLARLWDGTLRYPSFVNIGSADGGGYRADGAYAVDAAGVDAVQIEWIAGAVEVELGDGTQIEFSETAVSAQDALRWELKDGALRIQFCEDGLRTLPGKTLVLRIPASLAADMRLFSCECSSACLTVNAALCADTFRFSSSSGTLLAAGVDAGLAELSSSSGDLSFSGSYDELIAHSSSGRVTVEGPAAAVSTEAATASGEIALVGMGGAVTAETSSGAVSLDTGLCPESLRVDAGSGHVTLRLPADSAFTLAYDTASGELSCALPAALRGGELLCGGGGAALTVSTASGDLTILEN